VFDLVVDTPLFAFSVFLLIVLLLDVLGDGSSVVLFSTGKNFGSTARTVEAGRRSRFSCWIESVSVPDPRVLLFVQPR
jgi:hypothetical protein